MCHKGEFVVKRSATNRTAYTSRQLLVSWRALFSEYLIQLVIIRGLKLSITSSPSLPYSAEYSVTVHLSPQNTYKCSRWLLPRQKEMGMAWEIEVVELSSLCRWLESAFCCSSPHYSRVTSSCRSMHLQSAIFSLQLV